MKCALERINDYREMTSQMLKFPYYACKQFNKTICMQDRKGRVHEVPVYDENLQKINYLSKRTFLVKAENLPKQFGLELQVRNLHFDEHEPILAKHLVSGTSYISKLFFVFNLNNILLDDNQLFNHSGQQFGYSAIESSFNIPDGFTYCSPSENMIFGLGQ